MIKKIFSLSIFTALFIFIADPVFAQTIDPCPKSGSGANYQSLCRLDKDDLDAIIRNSITILFFIATVASLFFLIFGGIKWITSGGDKANVESARNFIIAAIIGLVITFLSYFIINIILSLVGLNTISRVSIPTLIE